MKNKISKKFFVALKYSFLAVIFLTFFILLFGKDIFIMITHLSHKNEMIFIKTFLKDFKNKDIENLRGYFLNEKNNIRVLKFMKMHDKNLQERIYYIDEFLPCYRLDKKTFKDVKVKNKSCVILSTIEKGKILNWIEIFIIKENDMYFIEHFQISEYFPRPPNEIF